MPMLTESPSTDPVYVFDEKVRVVLDGGSSHGIFTGPHADFDGYGGGMKPRESDYCRTLDEKLDVDGEDSGEGDEDEEKLG